MYQYRYESSYLCTDDWFGGSRPKVQFTLTRYPVLKETKCGAWTSVYGKKKFVNANARKQFAYRDRVAALAGYVARKQRQAAILRTQLERAETALKFLETVDGLPAVHEYTVHY